MKTFKEIVQQIQEGEVESADYKVSASGKKYKARHIVFDADKKEEVKEEILDVATTYKRLAVKHLKDLSSKDSTQAQKDYARKMNKRALEASKMNNHTDALNHYRGVSEELELDESLDPSEIASNPRMYSADSAKKAYYHKKASASDKESLAKHLDRYHGNKEWRKPVKESVEEAYGRRDDAYTRDYKSSVSGMGKRQSLAYHLDGGANDEGWDDHKPTKQADHPHAVHINGKKWKTFGSQSHATNVARKIKGATVHREEYDVKEEMSDEQMKKREDIVKGMKKNLSSFKDRYGADAKSVMYATATKLAKEELKGNQHKLDKNKNGKLDKHDFKLLRKEEQEITEATVETKKYSWGTMKTVHHGSSFSIPLHPEHHQAIHALKDQQEHKFKDETGRHWTAKRDGDNVHLHSANDGPKTTIKHSDLKEEVEQIEERNKENAIKRKMMDASRGAKYKLKNPVPDAEPEHKTAQAHNKAIGRALRNEEFELDEAVATGNPGRGYHGEHDSDKADAAYSKAHSMVKKVAGDAGHMRDVKKPNVMVKHYLDSQYGRHLKGNENVEYIKKDFGKFKKTYKPEMHESAEFGVEEKLSFSEFMQSLEEAWPGTPEYEKKFPKRVTGRGSRHDIVDTGTGVRATARYNDSDDESGESEKHEKTEKRGRGRPAGSKSGARTNK